MSNDAWTSEFLDMTETAMTVLRDQAREDAAYHDGRTTAGRRARIIDKHLTRLLEDLADTHDANEDALAS